MAKRQVPSPDVRLGATARDQMFLVAVTRDATLARRFAEPHDGSG